MTLEHYILKDKVPVSVTFMEWADWFETAKRHVAEETVGPYWVSTVFLGIDHQYGGGPPLLFETMVFPLEPNGDVNSLEEQCYRYSTWDDAEAGHKATVKRLWCKVTEQRLTEGAAPAAD
jgi:hypothetical protein